MLDNPVIAIMAWVTAGLMMLIVVVLVFAGLAYYVPRISGTRHADRPCLVQHDALTKDGLKVTLCDVYK